MRPSRRTLNPTNRKYLNVRVKTWLTVFIIILAGVIVYTLKVGVDSIFAPRYVYAQTSIIAPTPTPKVVEYSQDEIEDYIKTIFGKDSDLAIRVQHSECSPANRNYPRCVYHTDREYSVGIFQINLFNKDHSIHAGKIPGETMAEKIEWLKNPYNNTLVAFKIFKDSGFYPWSAYKRGDIR